MAQKLSGGRHFELRRLGVAIVGTCIYSMGMNLFIVPAGLYSGGIMGFCQIVRTLLTRELGLSFGGIDIAGILYYLINIPILIVSWRKLDRMFVLKTLATVSVMTLMLTLIPTIPIMGSDTITNCLVGGVISGIGIGIVLRCGGTLGGFDLVSLMIIRKHHDFSIGKITIGINFLVYALCMLVFSVPTAIYSMVYSVISSTTIDRVHLQNKDAQVTIITKKNAKELEAAILSQLHRGVTQLRGTGAYTNEQVDLLEITLSEYELPLLRRIIHEYDPNAFVVVKDHVKVYGNYLKKL